MNGEFIKEKIQEDLEKQAPPKQSQESDPNARIHETSPGNTSSEFITNESIANDLDCPIALRKGRGHVPVIQSTPLSLIKGCHLASQHLWQI